MSFAIISSRYGKDKAVAVIMVSQVADRQHIHLPVRERKDKHRNLIMLSVFAGNGVPGVRL